MMNFLKHLNHFLKIFKNNMNNMKNKSKKQEIIIRRNLRIIYGVKMMKNFQNIKNDFNKNNKIYKKIFQI